MQAALPAVESYRQPVGGTKRRDRRRSKRRRIAGVLFRGAFLLLVSVFLIGYAAAYLPPRWFWWTGVLAVTVPYTSLLLVLLAPLGFWRFSGRSRMVLAGLLLLVVIRFVPFGALFDRPVPGEDDLLLMTFNAPVRGPNPEALADATVELVRRVEPDLLALQEPMVWLEGVPGRRRMTAHMQAIVDRLDYWAPTPRRGAAPDLHQPVLARRRLGEVEQVPLEIAADAERPNFVLRVPFRWQGRDAVLYNLHLHTVGEKKPWKADRPRLFDLEFWRPYFLRYREAYLRRAREVEYVREMLARETVPVLVVGDLNSTVHHWEYRQLAKGLRNAFTQRGDGWGATYHARLPLVRIDHILAGPEWEIVSADVPGEHAYSDHRPVVARLRLR